MALFRGNVKPYVEIEGLGVSVSYGETINLAEWQIANPHFRFALKNKWVIAADKKALIYNTLEAKPPRESNLPRHTEIQNPPAREVIREVSGIDPAVLSQILEKQAVFLKSVQQSYDSLKKEVKENAPASTSVSVDMSPVHQAISALQEQQKQIVDHIKSKNDSHLMSALLEEIRNLSLAQQKPSVAPDSPQVVELLGQIQKTLENTKPQVIYNNGAVSNSEQKDGFRIQDFEEKYVPKVEDLDIKDSKIVTQQTQSGGVDDALAALKKLKQQMKK